jgi:hypothetical protein
MTPAPFVNIGPGARVPLRHLTRHAGVFGATGTGKTTTAGALLEGLAAAGVPVLALDAKGDLESLTRGPGGRMWDCTGKRGAVRRLDLAQMGPDLIARALDLSPAQAGALEIATAFAETRGLPLHTLADLRAVLGAVIQNAESLSFEFGLVTPASVAAVQRALLRIERTAPGAFGTPALDPFGADRRDPRTGRGRFTVLHAAPLMATPGLYGAAAAFILESLYKQAGELGDVSGPALAVFIDESHLIFDGAPRAVVQRLESVVRLIRSKGIALIFATQSPGDLPPAISGQLATRIQHGLRGSTAQGLREIRAAADTLPTASNLDAFEAIKGLGTGEALVSLPGEGGQPQPAKRVQIQAGKIALEPLADSELPTASHFPDGLPLISPTRPRSIVARIRAKLSLFN